MPLGCSDDYRAAIHLRGGRVLWVPLEPEQITDLSYGRKLGDYSEAQVTVAKRNLPRDCLGAIADAVDATGAITHPGVHAWSHELTIYRDGGIVWQGPITEPDETTTEITFNARDVLFWLDRRVTDVSFINDPANPPPTDAGALLRRLMEVTFPADDPLNDNNLREHWRIDEPAGRTYVFDQDVCKGSNTVGSLVRDICKVGIDMFTMGRRIYLVPNWYRLDQANRAPYRLRSEDFLGELEVREGGLDFCTEGYVYGKEPSQEPASDDPDADLYPCAQFGCWPHPGGNPDQDGKPGFASQWFGRVSKWQEAQETGDKNTLVDMARSIHEFGWPPPRAIVVPDGAKLAPTAPVTLNQLVPGRPFRVDLPEFVLNTSETFRLNEVEVQWSPPDPEAVKISLVSTKQPPDDQESPT